MKKDEDIKKSKCDCNETVEECNCEETCNCGDDCQCDADHKCSEDCTCDNERECACDECNKPKDNYLQDMLRVQAEFDNYRKRMQSALGDARTDGFIDAIEQFLPAIDSFKMASDMITDKNTLIGIRYIEKGILDTLAKMGVEEIDATGKFDPEKHQAVDTEDSTEHNSGDIVKVVSKGFTYKGKVIRYSQVIVKK